MIYKMKDLYNFKLRATDGEVGKVKEFFFDDRFWTIRYLVIDTGSWLTGKLVLIAPPSITGINAADKIIAANLSKKQVEASPSLGVDEPVSNQFETSYCGYYGWPRNWYFYNAWSILREPGRFSDEPSEPGDNAGTEECDPHLRSSKEITGYNIETKDGNAGNVEDFIIDDKTWMIRYLIVDPESWWPGKVVLISPKWIDNISWDERTAFVKLDRQTIRQAPEYDKDKPLAPEYEQELRRYYRSKGYPIDEGLMEVHQKP